MAVIEARGLRKTYGTTRPWTASTSTSRRAASWA